MEYIEITAKTVDEAITKACMQLEKPSEELDIQIISEGSKGFFGIGNKPAIIKAAVKFADGSNIIEEIIEKKEKPDSLLKSKNINNKDNKAAKEKKYEKAENKKSEIVKDKEKETAENRENEAEIKEKPRKQKNRKKEHDNRKNNNYNPEKISADEKDRPVYAEKKKEPVKKTEEEIAAMKQDSEKFLNDVLKAMEIKAEFEIEYVSETGSLDINILGENMGILIGKRGQTLDSLQYLTSLVVNKNQKDYIRIKLDTEDYRRRRKETLENLAKNIASKVKKTRRPVVLEPMNPYERRIIHSSLQSNKSVETYSDGNEPYRHVVVTLKKRVKEKD